MKERRKARAMDSSQAKRVAASFVNDNRPDASLLSVRMFLEAVMMRQDRESGVGLLACGRRGRPGGKGGQMIR